MLRLRGERLQDFWDLYLWAYLRRLFYANFWCSYFLLGQVAKRGDYSYRLTIGAKQEWLLLKVLGFETPQSLNPYPSHFVYIVPRCGDVGKVAVLLGRRKNYSAAGW